MYLGTVTVGCHVILVSGWLVDVDILELSAFPWPGVGICHTSRRLGRCMGKEFNQKVTLGLAERR